MLKYCLSQELSKPFCIGNILFKNKKTLVLLAKINRQFKMKINEKLS